MILRKLGPVGVARMCHDVKWKCPFPEHSLNRTPTEHEHGEDGLLSNVDQAVTTKHQKDPRRTCFVPMFHM